MSSAAVDVAVKLTLSDTASAGIAKAAQKAEADAAQVAEKSASLADKYGQKERDAYGKTAEARKVLGVRAEKTIQNEINRTEAAYKRLAASGLSSAAEQERAYAAMQRRVTSLTNEMGRMTAEQKKQLAIAKQSARGGALLGVGGVVGAGIYGAHQALRPKIETAMQYDYTLANMANTAFSERGLNGKRIGMKELESAINKAQHSGGGTRETAAEALDTMIASGAVSAKDSMGMLPSIVKAATAGNADPREIAQIAIRSMQNMKVKAEDMPSILNMALAGGQAGGFELKDMAKWPANGDG
jgi:Phage-related minor tail protein